MRKVFERKIDAENCLLMLQEESKARREGGRTTTFEGTTFKEEALHWLEMRRDEISPGYVVRIKSIFKALFPLYGDWSPAKFTHEFLNELRQRLKKEGRCSSTVNRWIDVITVALNFSARSKRIPYSPCSSFRKLKEIRESMDFWEKEEAETFLEFAERKYPVGSSKRSVYVVYLLALNTGIRAGEIWGLMPCDLTSDGLIRVERQYERVSCTFRHTKGQKSRVVPCSPELRQELLNVMANGNRGPRETIFSSPQGNVIDHQNFVNRCFHEDVKQAGIRRIRFHALRHTALTRMVATGLDLKTIQEIAGHSDIKTTMNYVHLVAGSIQKVPMLFGEKLSQKSVHDLRIISLKVM
jgi:integrase